MNDLKKEFENDFPNPWGRRSKILTEEEIKKKFTDPTHDAKIIYVDNNGDVVVENIGNQNITLIKEQIPQHNMGLNFFNSKPLMQKKDNSKPLMKDMFYYTPDITDLRIGYECEANITVFKVKEEWKFCTLKGVGPEVIEYHKQGVYRTPYLTQQDIENEGWEFKHKEENFSLIFEKNQIFNLEFIPARKEVRIKLQENMLFRGLCPSINELRTIQKLLEIK